MKHLIVTAAILINENQILCTQRGESKHVYISRKFEFPGGKVEDGESNKAAIVREIQEELKFQLDPINVIEYMTVEHTYPDFAITMHSFLCPVDSRDIVQTEHIDSIWLNQSELDKLDWAPADIPIVKKLMNEVSLP